MHTLTNARTHSLTHAHTHTHKTHTHTHQLASWPPILWIWVYPQW